MNYIFQFYYASAAYLNNEFEINFAKYARYFDYEFKMQIKMRSKTKKKNFEFKIKRVLMTA